MTPPKPRRNRPKRPYHPHGQGVVTRALPHLMERVLNPAVADDALSPVERAAGDWRQEVVADLGGLAAVPAAKLVLIDAAVGTKIVLDSLDRYLFQLATIDGLVNKRNRRAFAIVADRMRVADSLARQLAALGMERHAPLAPSLTDYLAQKKGGQDGSVAEATLPTDQDPPHPEVMMPVTNPTTTTTGTLETATSGPARSTTLPLFEHGSRDETGRGLPGSRERDMPPLSPKIGC